MPTLETGPIKLMTAEEAFRLPATNRRFELRKGVYRDMSPAGGEHGVIANNIAFVLSGHVRRHRLGLVLAAETGFILARNPDTVRAPDVAFIAAHRIPAEGVPTGYWPGAPDLAVEVVSPSDAPDDIQEKIEQYFGAGARMVWVVYPKTRSVARYRSLHELQVLRGQEVLDGEDVVSGFSCPVSTFFE
jgi:Uma2 family endonuclease